MPVVRRYKDLSTDLDSIYRALKREIQKTEDLDIIHELKGEVKGRQFWSVTAVRKSVPKAFIGALREVTITITGKPDDFIVEIHTGAWFNNLIVPATGTSLIAGPLDGVDCAGATAIIPIEYQRNLTKQLRELVKKHSKKELTLEKVTTFW